MTKLQKQLGDAAEGDIAKTGLEKISEQAADPKVRQAADKALQEGQRQPGTAKTGGPPGDNEAAKSNEKGPQQQNGKDADSAAVCHTDDGYGYVIMPLARDR